MDVNKKIVFLFYLLSVLLIHSFVLYAFLSVAERKEENKMSLSNLATVFGPSLLRPLVPRVDISQEVEVQVSCCFFFTK